VVTVIAGFTNGKQFAIGGDSGAFEEESNLYQRALEPKVWRAGNNLLGGAGSFRTITLAKKSGLSDPHELAKYLSEQNISGDWSIMVVSRRAIYELSSDGAVVQFREPYCAIGAGASVALGALSVLAGDPQRIVSQALSAAGKHTTSCVPPYKIFSSTL